MNTDNYLNLFEILQMVFMKSYFECKCFLKHCLFTSFMCDKHSSEKQSTTLRNTKVNFAIKHIWKHVTMQIFTKQKVALEI